MKALSLFQLKDEKQKVIISLTLSICQEYITSEPSRICQEHITNPVAGGASFQNCRKTLIYLSTLTEYTFLYIDQLTQKVTQFL